MIIPVKTSVGSYDIDIARGNIDRISTLLNLDRKVLIVTDDNVPCEYSEKVAKCCREPFITVVRSGERSKSINTWKHLLEIMLENSFSRRDAVVAVGGGVVGDLSGFAASAYMRGIDFYNIPTTVLSQIDSSIGGKTAVNLGNIKNIIGSFYPPSKVIIDTDLTTTLPRRQISNGLSEAVKMALTSDRELFEMMEREDPFSILEEITVRSLMIKKSVVEQDEKESGLRKVLNFGHTIGHGIESMRKTNKLYHGECVALGMLPMCSDAVRERLINVLRKLSLPTECHDDGDMIFEALTHDKKTHGKKITIITVNEPGSFEMKDVEISALREKIAYFE